MDKKEKYEELLPQLEALIKSGQPMLSILANTCAALHEKMQWLWTGFYLVSGDQLILGPFQGPPACFSIKYGRGVCGTAWKTGVSQVVPDVHQFPGHIACSSLSKSEIVCPFIEDTLGKTVGVLDIDSDKLNTFDEVDRVYLEKVCCMLGEVWNDGQLI